MTKEEIEKEKEATTQMITQLQAKLWKLVELENEKYSETYKTIVTSELSVVDSEIYQRIKDGKIIVVPKPIEAPIEETPIEENPIEEPINPIKLIKPLNP